MKTVIPEIIQDAFEKEPWQFDFVQLVRLMYLYQEDDTKLNQKMVGFENSPQDEVVRFKASPLMRHRSSDVRAIESLGDGRYSVEVSFLGLVGASGVLPHHYSQTVIDRLKANDESMRDFFDLFHHRVLSNFFRASVKYRLPFQHELFSRFKSDGNQSRSLKRVENDTISRSISCLVGLGERSIQDRLGIDDRHLMFYAGNFSNTRPTMIGLRRMLEEFSGMAVEILQFQFEWLYLDPADQTDLANPEKRLGENTVIGDRVGSIQNRFRVSLGPITWSQFQEMLPSGDRLKEFARFTRSYVGIGLDFDFQVILKGEEVPCMQLGNESCGRLGWNTWITSGQLTGTIEDAVFVVNDGFNPA